MSPPPSSAWTTAQVSGRIQPAESEAESGGEVDFTTMFYVVMLLGESTACKFAYRSNLDLQDLAAIKLQGSVIRINDLDQYLNSFVMGYLIAMHI
jgi:hypothetical protein